MLALTFDYHTNLEQYPQWQAWLRKHTPPTLVIWGKNDPIFPQAGAHAYLRDVPEAEVHILDTGHFALEDKVSGDRFAARPLPGSPGADMTIRTRRQNTKRAPRLAFPA